MDKRINKNEFTNVVPRPITNDNLWDKLPDHIKNGVHDSLAQANRGEFIPYEEVKKQVSALLFKYRA